MPVLFEGNAGKVVAVTDPTASVTMIPVVSSKQDDEAITLQEQRSIITSVSVSEQANYQFLHTLGNSVYIYSFGDRIGQLVLSGLSFPSVCPEDTSDEIGMVRMLEWYRRFKLSNRAEPLLITLGKSLVLTAFLAGITSRVVDAATKISQYDMTLLVVPEDE